MCRIVLKADGASLEFVFASNIIASKFVDTCFDTFDRKKEDLKVEIIQEEENEY